MAKTVKNINPAVLRWARDRKHYPLAEIAGKFPGSITEEVIADWEAGSRSPTYPQLEKLADCYKVPVAVFFFPEPPDIDDAAVSLRSTPDFDFDSISHNTLNVIHHVQATQMALKEFNDGVNPVSTPIHKRIGLNAFDVASADVFAETLRGEQFLNVPLDKQLSWNTYMQALDSWRDAIEEEGIFVFRWPLKSEHLSGFCLYDEEFPVICLDSQETKGRQIFTLVHELLHILQGASSVTLDKDGLEPREVDTVESERYFDRIAGSVLVPRYDLEKRFSAGGADSRDFYIQNARRYKVTPRMFLTTCRVNNLIPDNVFVDIQKPLETYGGEDSGSGGDYYRNHISYWGKAFLGNILNKRYENRISEYETARILNMKLKNIDILEGYLINKQAGM